MTIARLRFFLVLVTLLRPQANATDVPSTEQATYNGAGGLTSLICADNVLPVQAEIRSVLADGRVVSLQKTYPGPRLHRDGNERRWEGEVACPDGGRIGVSTGWSEARGEVVQSAVLTARDDLRARRIEWVVDLPRAIFTGGSVEPTGTVLPENKPDDATFFRGNPEKLTFVDAGRARRLTLDFGRACPVTITDRWDTVGRSYRVCAELRAGEWKQGDLLLVRLAILSALDTPPPAPPVRVTVTPGMARYRFDGCGGNYCWRATPASTDYLLGHLRHAWTRHELKADVWDRERAAPSGELTEDFEMMRRVQRLGIPWIISVWHLPQRLYTDPDQRSRGTMGRRIASERWDDLLDLLDSYLRYLKENYGAEPDLLSFNEPDLGIDVAFTPEEHRDAVKRIGVRLAASGSKTRLLLGDTANARDTHAYVLTAAADAEAMRYAGAVSFHSWGGASPAQYEAWAEVADWLRLPLLVAEVGVDPGAYKNYAYDSYAYGLSEARQFQELLRYARPRALLFWQYTTDYGLLRLTGDAPVEPTGRFWLIKHFSDLTPPAGQVVASTSDQADVLVSAIRQGGGLAVHVLNLGPAREAAVGGLAGGVWRSVTTTEGAFFVEGSLRIGEGGGKVALPARGLITLLRAEGS